MIFCQVDMDVREFNICHWSSSSSFQNTAKLCNVYNISGLSELCQEGFHYDLWSRDTESPTLTSIKPVLGHWPQKCYQMRWYYGQI